MQRILLNKDFFPDEIFRNAISYELNVDINTDITDLVLEIKELNLSYSNIVNIEGIQYFQNLEKVDLYNHKIDLINSNILDFIKSFPCLLEQVKLSRLNLELHG